jgi:hypothetical protein
MDAVVELDNPMCADKQVHQSMVSSLMYAALSTRPDIAFCVNIVSKYYANALQMHRTAHKGALRYIKPMGTYTLHIPGFENLPETNLDSDTGGSTGNRKYIEYMGGNIVQTRSQHQASVCWQARYQRAISL